MDEKENEVKARKGEDVMIKEEIKEKEKRS